MSFHKFIIFLTILLSTSAALAERRCTEYDVSRYQCGGLLQWCKERGLCLSWTYLDVKQGQEVVSSCVEYERVWVQTGGILQGEYRNAFCKRYEYQVIGNQNEADQETPNSGDDIKEIDYQGAYLVNAFETVNRSYCSSRDRVGLVMANEIVACLSSEKATEAMDEINQCQAIQVPTYLIPSGKVINGKLCRRGSVGVVVANQIFNCYRSIEDALESLKQRRGCVE